MGRQGATSGFLVSGPSVGYPGQGGEMDKEHVAVFRSYPFHAGQKIYIEDGPRRGDWEVVAMTDRKVKLRCPFSQREFEWDRFCYLAEERDDMPWPHPE
jgi:hypothetical protein